VERVRRANLARRTVWRLWFTMPSVDKGCVIAGMVE
jgi:hypothetical protein